MEAEDAGLGKCSSVATGGSLVQGSTVKEAGSLHPTQAQMALAFLPSCLREMLALASLFFPFGHNSVLFAAVLSGL